MSMVGGLVVRVVLLVVLMVASVLALAGILLMVVLLVETPMEEEITVAEDQIQSGSHISILVPTGGAFDMSMVLDADANGDDIICDNGIRCLCRRELFLSVTFSAWWC
jgi:hypothetical protein